LFKALFKPPAAWMSLVTCAMVTVPIWTPYSAPAKACTWFALVGIAIFDFLK
jgi:hypothetical protein